MRISVKKFFRASSMRIVVIGFAAVILLGAFFLCLPISHNDGEWFPFIDALFTSTSAVCVTGLIVVDTAVEYSFFGQFVIICLIQLGGLGFMTGAMMIFLILGKRITLQQRLLVKESFSQYKLQGIVLLIKKIILYTAIIELAGTIMLIIPFARKFSFWKALWTSSFTSISAFCNAGFDVLGVLGADGKMQFLGLTEYAGNAFVCLPIMMLIVTGGLGFSVLMEIVGIRGQKRLSLHARIVIITSMMLIALGGILFTIFEWNNEATMGGLTPGEKILAGFFQSVTPRTAGFNTIDQSAMTNPSKILTVVLMFIGASPASTGGGIKTTTFVIFLICVSSILTSKRNVNLGKERVSGEIIKKALATVALALSVVVIGAILITIFELHNEALAGLTTGEVLFECFSAFSTVGLSEGITPNLTTGSKFVLDLIMFIGRVGPLSMGVALAKKSNKQDNIIFPDAKIMIG